MKKFCLGIYLSLFMAVTFCAGHEQDSIQKEKVYRILPLIINMPKIEPLGILPEVKGTFINGGRKTELLIPANSDYAPAQRYGRQVFARAAGFFTYDMDGTGNQMNVSARGLDPHRSWEFNVRANGILTNSDMYGYPASHFNIPMEAIESVEIIRGAGALQYGAQFGGMINYQLRRPDTNSHFTLHTVNTIGSYGLFANYTQASGKINDIEYSAWFARRGSDGYRQNARSDYQGQGLQLWYKPMEKMSIQLSFMHSEYLTQVPGPLNDSMFAIQPRMSTRARSFYQPDIYIPALTLHWNPDTSLAISITASHLSGARNSILFDRPALIKDSINVATMAYNSRQVDIDNFNSTTIEARIRYLWQVDDLQIQTAAGIQLLYNKMQRRQLGVGSTGSDFDLQLKPGTDWQRNLWYDTKNIAFFAENRVLFSNGVSLYAGIRFESGNTDMTGNIIYYPADQVPNTIKHSFPLLGGGIAWKPAHGEYEFYANITQAYRPVLFKDIIPSNIYEITDSTLKDARGYTAEAGFRGKKAFFRWDITLFHILYQNRMGAQARPDSLNPLTVLRTNIGNSVHNGIELYAAYELPLANFNSISVFTASSYLDARYQDAVVRKGQQNIDISGNQVESAPEWNIRAGLTCVWRPMSITILYSTISSTFADPLNTVKPDANGAVGAVPGYDLLDIQATIRVTDNCVIRAGINNVLNKSYFTKRPAMYPGPGIWTSDGRNYSITTEFTL
jgi:Fe(3+) dicitrate transport protein